MRLGFIFFAFLPLVFCAKLSPAQPGKSESLKPGAGEAQSARLSRPRIKGGEKPVEVFILCSQKRATGLAIRTIAVHYLPEEEKCAAIYSREGKSRAIAYGKWLGHCRKMAEKTRRQLENSLWECADQADARIFYSGFSLH